MKSCLICPFSTTKTLMFSRKVYLIRFLFTLDLCQHLQVSKVIVFCRNCMYLQQGTEYVILRSPVGEKDSLKIKLDYQNTLKPIFCCFGKRFLFLQIFKIFVFYEYKLRRILFIKKCIKNLILLICLLRSFFHGGL